MRSPRRKRSDFSLHITADVGSAFIPYLRKNLIAGRRLIRCAIKELSLAMVNDATMSHLHQQFLNIAGATDVLTFELEHDSRGRVAAGEVVICVPEARRQAKKLKTDVRNELLLYAIHGMLHLAGFDDRTKSSYVDMHRKEDQILQKLGVGKVFAPKRDGRGK